MKILKSQNKEDWDKFIIENNGSFLQGFGWGDFQNKFLKKVWRFEIKEKEKTLACVQIIKDFFWLKKNFLYIPYGPCFKENLFNKDKKEVLEFILREVKKIANKEKSIFLKIESCIPIPSIKEEKKSLKRIQPKETIILDLKKTEEEILKQCRPKTRYNIKIAKKRGVEIIQDNSEKYFKEFYRLIEKTAKRDKFKPHSKDYYKKMLELKEAFLFSADFKGRVVAANIMIFFGKRATYLHGASDYKYRNLMAPYLLHLEQIRKAKNNRMQKYDFWGIDEKKWPGVTRFKRGFEGDEIKYPEVKDFIFKKEYYAVYRLLKKFYK